MNGQVTDSDRIFSCLDDKKAGRVEHIFDTTEMATVRIMGRSVFSATPINSAHNLPARKARQLSTQPKESPLSPAGVAGL